MDHVLGLRCVLCGKEYEVDEVLYVCPDHRDDGILDVIYDYRLISRNINPKSLARNPDHSIWRYKPLLPVQPDSPVPPLTVGWTPLYHAKRLGQKLGMPHLYIKDEGRQPTASLKDRASAVGVVKAMELGKEVIAAASTGNAASSLAGITASVGLKSIIFVPRTAPQGKIAQLLVYGATVLAVDGTYDQAFDLCLEASKEQGWYIRNTAYNPYLSEGKKTAVYEICEQLGWDAPDWIFVSVGDGCIIGGLGKGLRDLAALGWIEKMPRLMGVQAEGSAALYNAWKKGTEEVEPVEPHTIADSISVGLPRDRIKALRAVRDTNGAFITVSDEEILAAMRMLGQSMGVFAEPAGAAPLAGLLKALERGIVSPEEKVVVLVTGNGLKDVASAMKATGEPIFIAPSLEAVRKALHPKRGCRGRKPPAGGHGGCPPEKPFWRTALTYIEPDTIRIRGYDIAEIIDKLSFGDVFYLLIKGELPRGNEGKLIEAILVSCCDHSFLAPSVNATRFAASSGVPLAQAVAAGILTIGKYHGGAIENCAYALKEIMDSDPADLTEAARRYVKEKRAAGERIPGYGHPIHKSDPRVGALIKKAQELGLRGRYVELALEIERALEEEIGRRIPINVDGAIAALMLEMGLDPKLGSAFFIISRLPGLVAHAYEEATRERPFRRVDYREIEYDGPPKRSLAER